MIGKDIVFRQFNDKTVISAPPVRDYSIQTEKQKSAINNFRKATLYAKSVMAVPTLKVEFAAVARAKGLPNAYTAAITIFMSPAMLQEARWVGSGNSSEFILALYFKENYKFSRINVTLLNARGESIDTGAAFFYFGDDAWRYLVKSRELYDSAVSVKVDTFDRLAQSTKFEVAIGGRI